MRKRNKEKFVFFKKGNLKKNEIKEIVKKNEDLKKKN